ncbi:Carbon catabolite repressor protein 4-like protein 3 [Diplonema papillatum]|nr:Carbon catabolite repressor protein 4-like protein 3 [Diplonema papillatum]
MLASRILRALPKERVECELVRSVKSLQSDENGDEGETACIAVYFSDGNTASMFRKGAELLEKTLRRLAKCKSIAKNAPLALLDADGAALPDSLRNDEAWAGARALAVGGDGGRRIPVYYKVPQLCQAELTCDQPYVGVPMAVTGHRGWRAGVEFPEDPTVELTCEWKCEGKTLGTGVVFVPAEETCDPLEVVVTPVRRSPGTKPGDDTYEAGTPATLRTSARVTKQPEYDKVKAKHNLWKKRAPADSAGAAPPFRVATYNVLADIFAAGTQHGREVLYPHVTEETLSIDHRMPAILHDVVAMDPELLSLQEVGHSFFKKLRAILQLLGYEGWHEAKHGAGIEGGAIFWKTTRFALVSREVVPLGGDVRNIPFAPSVAEAVAAHAVVKATFEDYVVSILQLATFSCKVTGKRFVYGNTHLFYHPEGNPIRALQIHAIFAKVEALGAGDAFILTGDLNTVEHPCPLPLQTWIGAKVSAANNRARRLFDADAEAAAGGGGGGDDAWCERWLADKMKRGALTVRRPVTRGECVDGRTSFEQPAEPAAAGGVSAVKKWCERGVHRIQHVVADFLHPGDRPAGAAHGDAARSSALVFSNAGGDQPFVLHTEGPHYQVLLTPGRVNMQTHDGRPTEAPASLSADGSGLKGLPTGKVSPSHNEQEVPDASPAPSSTEGGETPASAKPARSPSGAPAAAEPTTPFSFEKGGPGWPVRRIGYDCRSGTLVFGCEGRRPEAGSAFAVGPGSDEDDPVVKEGAGASFDISVCLSIRDRVVLGSIVELVEDSDTCDITGLPAFYPPPAAMRLLQGCTLEKSDLDWRYTQFLPGDSEPRGAGLDIELALPFRLCDPNRGRLPFTIHSATFSEVLDYTLFSPKSFRAVGLMVPPMLGEVAKTPGLPNEVHPSDHIPVFVDLCFL